MRSTDSARSTAEPRSASRTRGGGGTGGGAAARKKERRHQIPGLRNTPYLKVYILRCDDNDSYKNTQRKLLREWVTTHATDVGGDNHDAFEWLILHVVLPGTPAALQPRSSSTSGSASGAGRGWMKGGSVSLLDKIKSDFNGSNAKVDRVAQIRIPAAHPALATLSPPVAAAGGSVPESVAEVEAAWADLVGKLKSLILTSFDARVGQYEEDVRERDSQRKHPGWNFCTFFVLKEGLARAFESVGLVEDALVLYDELGFGLEAIVREQEKGAVIGGGFVPWTNEGRHWLQQATNMLIGRKLGDPVGQEEEGEDGDGNLIDADRKPYRDLILSNDISIFDFRCYLFSRQATLLLRLGRRCWEPGALEPVSGEVEGDDLTRLAEVCMRTIEFVTSVSRVLRGDLALAAEVERRERLKKKVAAGQTEPTEPDGFSYEELEAIVDNLVSSWGYSVCAQLLAETGSAALPEGLEQGGGKGLLPKRSSSLVGSKTPSFSQAVKSGITGFEEVATARADLMVLARSVLEGVAKRRGWVSREEWFVVVGEMQDIDLDAEDVRPKKSLWLPEGIRNRGLKEAVGDDEGLQFYEQFATLSDRAMKHYGIAKKFKSAERVESDLAALKLWVVSCLLEG